MTKKMKFEEALKELEEIVGRLEQGEESLEESLKLFEDGMKLARLCSRRLEEAEKKVEILKHREDGSVKRESFHLNDEKATYQKEAKRDEHNQLLL